MRRLILVLLLCFQAQVCAAETIPAAADTAIRASEPAAIGYAVGIGDVLDIRVLRPEEITVTATVAPDGSITFPYIGNVQVKGMALASIQERIQAQLADGYMKYPVVQVGLRETHSNNFFVYGEVNKPGSYPLGDRTTVLEAISIAGGFTKFGSSSRVKVLRKREAGPGYDTIKVNINAIMRGIGQSDMILRPGDIVVVSEGVF